MGNPQIWIAHPGGTVDFQYKILSPEELNSANDQLYALQKQVIDGEETDHWWSSLTHNWFVVTRWLTERGYKQSGITPDLATFKKGRIWLFVWRGSGSFIWEIGNANPTPQK